VSEDIVDRNNDDDPLLICGARSTMAASASTSSTKGIPDASAPAGTKATGQLGLAAYRAGPSNVTSARTPLKKRLPVKKGYR